MWWRHTPYVNDLVTLATVVLHGVHRPVSFDDELVGDVLARTCECNADTGRDGHGGVGQHERSRHGGVDARRETVDIVGTREVFTQDDELVTGETGQRVARPDQAGEALRDGAEQFVADVMAVGVVHVFEVVEVGEQHRSMGVGPPRALGGMFDPFLEEQPVGQTRERVMRREVLQTIGHEVGLVTRLRVDDVRGRHIGQSLRCFAIVSVEVTRRCAVEVERAEAAFPMPERKRERRGKPELHRGHRELGEAVVSGEVGDRDSLARRVGAQAGALMKVGLQLLELQRVAVRGGDVMGCLAC